LFRSKDKQQTEGSHAGAAVGEQTILAPGFDDKELNRKEPYRGSKNNRAENKDYLDATTLELAA
jgi:hypothetical protein